MSMHDATLVAIQRRHLQRNYSQTATGHRARVGDQHCTLPGISGASVPYSGYEAPCFPADKEP